MAGLDDTGADLPERIAVRDAIMGTRDHLDRLRASRTASYRAGSSRTVPRGPLPGAAPLVFPARVVTPPPDPEDTDENTAGRGRRRTITPAELEEARRMVEVEGVSLRATAARIGVSEAAVYYRAKLHGWDTSKLPQRAKPQAAVAPPWGMGR